VDELCWGVWDVYKYSDAARTLERNVIDWASRAGVRCTVTSRLRTCDQQARLYRAGKTTAAPGTSQHEFGYAFDAVPTGGFERYGATKAQAIAWLVAVSRAFGGDGLAEGSHAHLTVFSNAAWRNFLQAREAGVWLPIPGRRR
jgi:hypothetical protein